MTLYLSSDQSIGNNDFFGLGTSSSSFSRNTVVIPQDAMITGLILNIRNNDVDVNESVEAEIFIDRNCAFSPPTATGIVATITGPSDSSNPNCCGITFQTFSVQQCDLLSVQIRRVNGNNAGFSTGVAATVLFTIS